MWIRPSRQHHQPQLGDTLAAYATPSPGVEASRLRRPVPTGLEERIGLLAALTPFLPTRAWDPRITPVRMLTPQQIASAAA